MLERLSWYIQLTSIYKIQSVQGFLLVMPKLFDFPRCMYPLAFVLAVNFKDKKIQNYDTGIHRRMDK